MGASASTIECSIPQIRNLNDSIYSLHDDDPLDHKIEIIFFHDIQWNLQEYKEPHIQTWMSTSTAGRPSVCWPRDLLKKRIPGARILFASYDGAMWKTHSDARVTLLNLAENLVSDILSKYKKTSRIFLVGHGFGGILIKRIIRLMSEYAHELESNLFLKLESDLFLNNVEGVFYFATPFLGSEAADSTKDLPNRGPLLTFLEVFNPELSELNQWFRKYRQGRRFKAVAVSTARRTKVAVPFVWRILQALFCRRRTVHLIIAPEGASRFDVDEHYTVPVDHFNICKLRSETDSTFQLLIRLIDPEKLNSTNEPGPHTMEIKEVASIEFVEKISRQIVGQGTVYLPMRSIESKFPKVRLRLEEAGLKQRSPPIGPGVEMWGR